MKKIIVLTLALLLLLTGCGKAPPEQGRPAPQTEAPATTASETETPETTAPEEKPLSLGTIQDGVYTNTYAGIGLSLEEGWEWAGAEELQQLPEAVMEAMDGSDLAEKMKDVVTFVDIQGENAELLATVNVVYTQLDMASRMAYLVLSDEEVIDGTLAQGDLLTAAYAQSGIEVESMEKVTAQFLGEDRWAMKTTATNQGLPCYILQVMDYRLGQFGITVTCTTFLEDRTQEVLDLFYRVEG